MPKDSYQKYLEDKHSKFNTPKEMIGIIVKKATNFTLISLKQVIAGEVNEVYDAVVDGAPNVIVRISREEQPRFYVEKQMMLLSRAAGVPAPKVLLIESVNVENEKRTFCIEEKIEGIPLKEMFTNLDKKTLRNIIGEAGEILSKIHSVTAPGYGSLAREQTHGSWKDYVLSIENHKDKISDAVQGMKLNTKMVDKAIDLLKENEKLYSIDKPQLLHGDFSPKHLLLKESHVVGVLDFENCKGGDPVHDFAWFDYFYSEHINIDWLIAGYQNKNIFDKNFDLKMKLYRLILALSFAAYYTKEKNASGITYTKKGLFRNWKVLTCNPTFIILG